MIELLAFGVCSIPNNNIKRSILSSKKNKKIKKQIVREVGVGLASMAIGETNARNFYKAGAKANRARKMVRNSRPKVRRIGASVMKLFSQPTNRGLVLSDPARLYLKSFTDPFDQSVKAVGLPRPGSMPSYKVTGFVRGVGYIGAGGLGYVLFAPTLCNDLPCVCTTSADFAGTIIAGLPSNGSPGYVASAFSPGGVVMSNLPYTSTQLTVTSTVATASSIVEGRIVSSALRIYYTGTTLNQSGQYYGYVDPDLEPVIGQIHDTTTAVTLGYTVSTLGAKDACEIKGADRQGLSVIVVPNNNNLVDYPSNGAGTNRKIFPFSNNLTHGAAGISPGAPPAIIAVTGVTGQSFYYEAIVHAEYIGPAVPQSLLTQSFSDTVGFDSIQMMLNRAQRRCASDARKTFKQCLMAEASTDGIRL